MEFEKICTWFERVQERDWFGAPNRDEAREWLRRCESLLEEFEGKVFDLQGGAGDADERSHLRALPGLEASYGAPSMICKARLTRKELS
jgi:hypothetical protein